MHNIITQSFTLIFISIMIFGLGSLEAKAQSLRGCGKNGTGMIHYTRNGFGTGLNILKEKYNVNPYSTLTSNTAICPRFTSYSLILPQTLCCIDTDCATDNFLYTFTNIPCPLDTNSGILLVIMGGVGGLVVRRVTKNT